MYSKKVVVNSGIGLRADVAARFVQQADAFMCPTWVTYDGGRAPARSLLAILALGIDMGSEITIHANGIDEEAAVESLSEILG